ncbi:MAG: hypothetical protein LBU34_05195 [Planctomycetaceae bacterium]|nr:hypothetical protein [Planctomycetaceae bacterium]
MYITGGSNFSMVGNPSPKGCVGLPTTRNIQIGVNRLVLCPARAIESSPPQHGGLTSPHHNLALKGQY